jgi:hypothetical protein
MTQAGIGRSPKSKISLTQVAERPQADEIARETTTGVFPLKVEALRSDARPAIQSMDEMRMTGHGVVDMTGPDAGTLLPSEEAKLRCRA